MKRKVLFMILLSLLIIPKVIAAEADVEEVSSWEDLKSCLEGSTSKTCKVTQNIEEDEGQGYIFMNSGDKKILDVQGFTVKMSHVIYVHTSLSITGTSAGKIIGPKQNVMIMPLAGGTLNVDNITLEAGHMSEICSGSKNCEGQVISISGINNHVTIGKNATLVGGYGVVFQYYSTSNSATNEENMKVGADGSELNVYGTIQASEIGGMGITIKGDITGNNHFIHDNAPVVNIYEGSKILAKDSSAIYGAGYGIWNIKGGYLEGNEALSIKSGEFNITGGTLKAVGDYIANPPAVPGAQEPTGAAISITSRENYDGHIKVKISGPVNVISEKGNAIFEGGVDTEESQLLDLQISKGNFTSAEGKDAVTISEKFAENHGKFITGGKFLSGTAEADVTKYVKSGYAEDENGNVIKKLPSSKPSNNKEENKEEDNYTQVIAPEANISNASDNVSNPNTGDNVYYYIAAFVGSLWGIGITFKKYFN